MSRASRDFTPGDRFILMFSVGMLYAKAFGVVHGLILALVVAVVGLIVDVALEKKKP